MVWRSSGLPNPRVYMDVAVGGRDVGRMTFELFADHLPITCENFRALCTGETGLGYWLKPRWYKHTHMYRVVPGFMCQGGDFNYNTGQMGESIYGQYFRSERFLYKHSKRGILSMASCLRKNSNSSNFFITFDSAPWLDSQQVAFGQVESGWNVLDEIEKVGSEGGKTRRTVEIFNCGELLPDTFHRLSVDNQAYETRRHLEFQSMNEKDPSIEIPRLTLLDSSGNLNSLPRPELLDEPPMEEVVPTEVYRKYKSL